MVVGQDVALRAHNHARTEALGTLLIGNIRKLIAAELVAEKLAERIELALILSVTRSPVFTTLDDLMLTTVGTTAFTTGAKPVRLGATFGVGELQGRRRIRLRISFAREPRPGRPILTPKLMP